MIRNILTVSASAVLLSLLGSASHAESVLFDLEAQALQTGTVQHSLGFNGIGLDIRKSGESFSFVDLSSGSGTVAFGSRSIVPDQEDGGKPFVINFTAPAGKFINSFGLQAGDFGDDLDNVTLTALNKNGAVLDTANSSLVPIGTNFSTLSLLVEGKGIASVQISGGSVALDNFGVTAIPLPPAAYAVIGGAVVAVGCRWNLRRRSIA